MNRSKYLWVWTLLSLALFGCQAANLDDLSFDGKCIRVFDGDTIEVLRGDEAVRVRLHGVDTPERTQPFSSVARKRTGELLKNKIVRIEVKDRDRYERIVARVFVDKEDLSILLVREGLAWHYSHYSSDPRLAYYQLKARRKRLGLWQDREPEAPWDFRRRQRAER